MTKANSDMKFTVDGDLLANILPNFMHIAQTNLYFSATDNALEIKAGYSKFIATARITDGVTVISAGDFLLPNKGAKMLARILRDARYTFTADKNTLTVDTTDGVFEFSREKSKSCLAPFERERVTGTNTITLDGAELKRLLDRTLYTTADEKGRPLFTTVNFKTENDSLILAATDSKRLSVTTTKLFSAQGEFNCNIDADILRFILPLLKSQKDVQITFKPPQDIGITLDAFTIDACCLMAGETFPDYSRAIPKSNLFGIKARRSELKAAVKFCSPFADKHGAIRLCFEKGAVIVDSAAYETKEYKTTDFNETHLPVAQNNIMIRKVTLGGAATVPVEAEVAGIDENYATAGINAKFLFDALDHFSSSAATLALSENAITLREENLITVIALIKDSVKIVETAPAITPPMPEQTVTIDVEAKVNVA